MQILYYFLISLLLFSFILCFIGFISCFFCFLRYIRNFRGVDNGNSDKSNS